MKLGTDTGSLTNHLMSAERDLIPVIGIGATELCWSDRHPYTIIDISPTGKTITIQRDIAKRIDKNGMSDTQEYSYERDTDGVIYKARKDKSGRWKILRGNRINIGEREKYYDYSF